jgi:hypothetical protein
MLEKQAVNGKFYKEVIERLTHSIRPGFQGSGSWYLMHNDASVHSSEFVSKSLVKRGIPVLSHPPYSLDLTPTDFFCFLN